MSDPKLVDCPECSAPALRKQVTAAAFKLKGTGWYETDFKNSGKPAPAKTAETGNESKDSASASGESAATSASSSGSPSSASSASPKTSDSTQSGATA